MTERDLSDNECFRKAQARGDVTFTVVGQDVTSASVVCEWIRQNIYTCPEDKLYEALKRAIAMRDKASAGKTAD
jgi:hypothetical protein